MMYYPNVLLDPICLKEFCFIVISEIYSFVFSFVQSLSGFDINVLLASRKKKMWEFSFFFYVLVLLGWVYSLVIFSISSMETNLLQRSFLVSYNSLVFSLLWSSIQSTISICILHWSQELFEYSSKAAFIFTTLWFFYNIFPLWELLKFSLGHI